MDYFFTMQNTGNTIAEKFGKGRTVFSVEFFPPKTEEGARQILRTANRLRKVGPDFVSITYGAEGRAASARSNTASCSGKFSGSR